MMTSENTAAADLFGSRTGRHTHPVTHPLWLEFEDGNCVVCGNLQLKLCADGSCPNTLRADDPRTFCLYHGGGRA